MELSWVRVWSLRSGCKGGGEGGRVQKRHEVCVEVREEDGERAMKRANDSLAKMRILPRGVELTRSF